MLAVVAAALIAFALANAYPILELRVQGIASAATLLGSSITLWREGRELVAAMVFATTWLAPLFNLLAMAALLLEALSGQRPPFFAPLLHLLRAQIRRSTGFRPTRCSSIAHTSSDVAGASRRKPALKTSWARGSAAA